MHIVLSKIQKWGDKHVEPDSESESESGNNPEGIKNREQSKRNETLDP